MLANAVVFFLGVSLLLYFLLAGADFGAGILEAFSGRKNAREQKKVIADAIAPVWEANHVWLILAVVILFVGFPKAYALLSINFHVPITIMLIGIILRGCAFTFRHYDAVRDKSEKYYSLIFMVSSILTPMMLGSVAGGTLLGKMSLHPTDFFSGFIAPWFNLFSLSVGVFTCILFAFLASVFLIGEATNAEIRNIFISRARVLNILAIFSGALVFLGAQASDFYLVGLFTSSPLSVLSMAAATFLLLPLWAAIRGGRSHWARLYVAAQVGFILVGWFALQFPVVINSRIEGFPPITFERSAAPESTLRLLLLSLILGSILIFPALYYLMKIFKSPRLEA